MLYILTCLKEAHFDLNSVRTKSEHEAVRTNHPKY